MSEPSLPWHEGIPVEKIEELAKTFSEVKIYVKRRNQWKKLAAVPQISGSMISTIELIDFERYAQERTGGGDYEVECHNPLGTAPRILLRFKCPVEGPVLAPPPSQLPPLPPGAPPLAFQQGTPVSQQPNSPWVQGLSIQDQMAYNASIQPRWQPPQAPVMQVNPAESATNAALYRQLGEVQSQLRAEQAVTLSLRERLESEKLSLRDKLETEKLARSTQQTDLQRQHDRDMSQLRLELETKLAAKEDKFQAERDRWNEDRRRTDDERRKAETEAMRREMELIRSQKADGSADKMMVLHRLSSEAQQNHMNMMMGLLTKPQANGAEAIMPVLMKMMDARAPEAQAALLGQMMENQIASIGAMSAMLREQAGPEPSPWIQMGMQALEGMKGIAASMMRDGANSRQAQQQLVTAVAPQLAPGLTAQLAPQQQPQQPQQQQPPPGPSVFSSQPFIETTGETIITPTPNGNGAAPQPPVELSPEMAKRLRVENEVDQMFSVLPRDFATPEWRRILVELHLESENAPELIARHIEWHFLFEHPLPVALKGFRENPRGALEGLVGWLPINSSNPGYTKSVVDAVVDAFTEDVDERMQRLGIAREDFEEAEEQGEEEPIVQAEA